MDEQDIDEGFPSAAAPNNRWVDIQAEVQATTIRFWRGLGFGRIGPSHFFAFANDAQHPAHSVAAEDDFSENEPVAP